MTSILLYNLGNSDIEIVDNRNKKYSRIDELRENTRLLSLSDLKIDNDGLLLENELSLRMADGKTLVKAIRFPLFIQLMAKIIEEYSQKPEKIILFTTNQSQRHKQDTIYLSGIMKKFCVKKYGYGEEEITIAQIKGDPSDYDAMAGFYQDFIERSIGVFRNNLLLIFLSPGTPAMSMSLPLNTMHLSVKYYYLSRQSGEVYKVQLYEQINKQRYLKIIEILLESYDYANAYKVIINSPFSTCDYEVRTIEVLGYLRNIDIQHCLKLLNDSKENEKYCFLKSFVHDMNENPQGKLGIIYFLAEMYLSNKEYIEFTGIFFGMMENVRNEVFKKVYGFEIKKDKKGEFPEFNKLCEQYKQEFKKDIRWENNPTRIVVNKLIASKNKENNIAKKYSEIAKKCEKIQELRNKIPFAHGSQGVKEDDLKDISITLNQVKDLLTELGIIAKDSPNIFEKNNEILVSSLKDSLNL